MSGILVSCLMPSCRTPAEARAAVDCFRRQTYMPRELIFVRPLDREVPPYFNNDYIWTHYVPPGLSIGELRNVACRLARGSVFVHVDDDDWSHPTRLEQIVEAITLHKADVVGTSLVRYFDTEQRQGWLWDGNLQPTDELARLGGCTLAYKRRVWEVNQFNSELTVGEDTIWQREVNKRGFHFHDLRDPSIFAARMHEGNTSRKRPFAPVWTPIDYEEVFA